MRIKAKVVHPDVCGVGCIGFQVSLIAADNHATAIVTKPHGRSDLLVRRGT